MTGHAHSCRSPRPPCAHRRRARVRRASGHRRQRRPRVLARDASVLRRYDCGYADDRRDADVDQHVGNPSVNIFGPPQIMGPNQNAFMLGPSMCPPTLGPNGTCSVNVRFSPPGVGAFNAQVQVNNDAAARLSGHWTAPAWQRISPLSPNSTDFGLVPVDERDETRSVIVQNTGSATVQVNQIEINGPDSGAFRTDQRQLPASDRSPPTRPAR